MYGKLLAKNYKYTPSPFSMNFIINLIVNYFKEDFWLKKTCPKEVLCIKFPEYGFSLIRILACFV